MTLAGEVLVKMQGTVDGQEWMRRFGNQLDQSGPEYLHTLINRFNDSV